jgi:hypothetical protein
MRIIAAVTLVWIFFFQPAGQARADEVAALKLRRLIEVQPHERERFKALKNSTKLRVTRGFSQGGSQLCWAFSTLNMLETNYLELNPDVAAPEVELSRWYIGKLAGSTQQRGTSIDALNHYMTPRGIVMNADYPKYGPVVPETTVFRGVAQTPQSLFEAMVGPSQFWSYAFNGQKPGWGPHPDPDALSGTRSFYLDREMMDDVIATAIEERRSAVTYTEGGHIVQIYGVTRGDGGDVEFYHVKDSYSPYFYDAAASRVHANGFEVTTLARPDIMRY